MIRILFRFSLVQTKGSWIGKLVNYSISSNLSSGDFTSDKIRKCRQNAVSGMIVRIL